MADEEEKKEKDKKEKVKKEWTDSIKTMLNGDSIALSGLPKTDADSLGFTPIQYLGLKK